MERFYIGRNARHYFADSLGEDHCDWLSYAELSTVPIHFRKCKYLGEDRIGSRIALMSDVEGPWYSSAGIGLSVRNVAPGIEQIVSLSDCNNGSSQWRVLAESEEFEMFVPERTKVRLRNAIQRNQETLLLTAPIL